MGAGFVSSVARWDEAGAHDTARVRHVFRNCSETPRCQSSYKCVTPELLNLFCMLPSRVYRNGTIWKLRSSYSQQPVLYTGILPVYGDSLDAQRSWLIHLCGRLRSPCSACFFSMVLHTHACSASRQR